MATRKRPWSGIEYAERQATLWHNRLAHIILYGIDERGMENLREADRALYALLEQRVPGNPKHRVARWWESRKTSLRRMWNEAVEVAEGTRAPKLGERGGRDRDPVRLFRRSPTKEQQKSERTHWYRRGVADGERDARRGVQEPIFAKLRTGVEAISIQARPTTLSVADAGRAYLRGYKVGLVRSSRDPRRHPAVRIPKAKRAAVSKRLKRLVAEGYSPGYAAKRAYHGRDPKLTAAQRRALPQSAYALPKRRQLPLERVPGRLDPKHIRNAASRLAQMHKRGTVTESEYRAAHAKIARAEARLGIKSRGMTTHDRDPLPDRIRMAVATLSYNRAFKARDLAEYTGTSSAFAQSVIRKLSKNKMLRKVEGGQWYPTSKGWDWIEGRPLSSDWYDEHGMRRSRS